MSLWHDRDGVYQFKNGKYVFIPDLKIGYFVSRLSFYKHDGVFSSYFTIPFTVFGKFKESKNSILIEYYLSVRIAFLVGSVVLTLLALPIVHKSIEAYLFVIPAIFILFLILYVIYKMTIRIKILDIKDEIEIIANENI
jgi:hypothetical protein